MGFITFKDDGGGSRRNIFKQVKKNEKTREKCHQKKKRKKLNGLSFMHV